MLRMTLIALAAVSALGVSAASAAPFNAYVVGAAVAENGAIQQVWWGYRHYQHRWFRHHHRRWW
jgi:hypothetical protein